MNGLFWTLICANYTDAELADLTWWCKTFENVYAAIRGEELPWKEHGYAPDKRA